MNSKNERLSLALNDYQKNDISLRDLSKKYHLQRYELSNYLKNNSVKVKNRTDKEDYIPAMNEYLSSTELNLKDICKKYGIHSYTFKKFLEKNNVKIRKRIYEFDESFFFNIDDEDKAYWFGFIAADGYISKSNKQLAFNQSSVDDCHLMKFAKIFNSTTKIVDVFDKRTKKAYVKSRFVLSSKKICSDLIDKGIFNKKSLTMTDECANYVPESLLNHFIRGYFDGDGCIREYKNEYSFALAGTEMFLDRIKKILKIKIGVSDVKNSFNRGINQISYGGNRQLLRIREWLYSNSTVFLERKKETFENIEIKKNKTTGYTGVHWCNTKKKWIARIYFCGKMKYLGSFNNDIDAAKSYDTFICQSGIPKYKLNFSTSEF